MEYYITDNIYIKSNNMFIINDDKHIKINKYNWHYYLNYIGWEKLNREWIISINKLSKIKEKNSRFGIYKVPGDGDCFFHCLAYALNEKTGYCEYNSNDIRILISNGIDENMYKESIRYYKIMKEYGDFNHEWDPEDIHNIHDYRNIISTSGHMYWLDHILLSHVTKIFNINLLILENLSIYNTLIDFDSNKPTIILLYEDLHFNLLGYFKDMMNTYFYELPIEIHKIMKLKKL